MKRGNDKYGKEEVSKLANDSLCNKIYKDLFDKMLDNLHEIQTENCNIVRKGMLIYAKMLGTT